MPNSEIDSENVINKLVLNFFNSCLNFSLQPEEVEIMTWDQQEVFLDATIHKGTVKKYPMSNEFCRLFFKKMIDLLEPCQEVHDGFYTFLCSMLNNSSDRDFSYRHYFVRNLEKFIIMKETKNMVINGTTGMRTWQAALMLADWAICNENVFKNKNILELGSGVGFTGITIAKACNIQSILLTDYHSDVLTSIKENIKINFPDFEQSGSEQDCEYSTFNKQQKKIGVMMLDWNYTEDLPKDIVPDIIIGADIIYDPCILKPLCNIIKTFFNRNKYLEVYIANIIRNEETFQSFINLINSMNFTCDKLCQTKSVFIDWDSSIQRCLLKIKLKR